MEYFQPELPKKTRHLTKEERRKRNGKPLWRVYQELNGFKIQEPPQSARIVIENNAMRTKNYR